MSIESLSLPDDAWFEILARLPAQDVYDLARLVCWKWYRMIYTHNFIIANLEYTPYGLLIKCKNDVAFFVTMRQGQIEFSEMSHRFVSTVSWSSCNGLSLESEPRDLRILYIRNPITKQLFVLPPTNAGIQVFNACSIGCSSTSMEYKVVITYSSFRDIHVWGILTPGVDSSWRVVRTDHIPYLATRNGFITQTPLITEGFMHWPLPHSQSERRRRSLYRWTGNEVLTLDLETEILTKSSVPVNYRENDCWCYISNGKCLTLLISDGGILWDVWEMMKSGEWIKMDGVVVDLGIEQSFFFNAYPVGWLKYLEVLVFYVYQHFTVKVELSYAFVYNLPTKKIIDVLQVPDPYYKGDCRSYNLSVFRPVVHKNSLTWLA